jgi:SAM-dependent methyltransferase
VAIDYVLAVGNKGAERLESVQFLYGEESKLLLKKAGIKPGMIVMDLGCGTGLMTKWLAEQVGDTGQVIAVDNSESQLELAKKYIATNKITNVKYLCKDIHELSTNDLSHIELLYSRLLLVHNKTPLSFIQGLKNKCKKNMIYVLEEPITSESECLPISESFNKHLNLYCGLGQRAGFNYDFGRLLTDLILQAGLGIDGIRKTKNFFRDQSAKLIAYRRTRECADKYLQNNMISQKEIEILLKELIELADNELTLVSGVSMMQIWGKVC